MDVMAKIWHGQFLSGAKFVETPTPADGPNKSIQAHSYGHFDGLCPICT